MVTTPTKIDQEQYQADLEFKAKLDAATDGDARKSISKALRDADKIIYFSSRLYIASMPKEANPILAEPTQPTLADAIKISADPFIKKEGVYGGKPSIQQVINPEYTKV